MKCLFLPLQGSSFKSAPSPYRSHNSSSVTRARQSNESRPQLVKSSSVSAGWQPWMPIPPSETSVADVDVEDSAFSPVHTQPSLSSSSSSTSSFFKLPFHTEPLPQRPAGVFGQQPGDPGGVRRRGLRASEAPLAASASQQLQLPLQSG